MKKTITQLLIVSAVLAGYLLDLFAPIERGLTSLRFQILAKPASGEVILVGIDNRSLKSLNVWPWPREYHAELVDRIAAAGADLIALDIDFSSHSNAASDARFEASLKRAADKMILATFKQPVSDSPELDGYVYTAPIPRFARWGTLGHVNVQVESDSLVWTYDTFERIDDVRLPGMATLLARNQGAGSFSFTIDYSIRPDTLPYVSFADVLAGRIDPAVFAGKTVIVGAAALELGDRIPVPVHHVLPGPVVQALIAETMVQGRGLHKFAPWQIALLALLAGLAGGRLIVRLSWKKGALAIIALTVFLFAASVGVQQNWPRLLEISPILIAPAALYLLNLTNLIDQFAGAFRRERFESMYRRAMMNAVVDSGFDAIAIADRDGNIELVNPSATRLIGQSAGQLEGIPVHSVLPWSAEIESLYGNGREGDKRVNTVGPLELELKTEDALIYIELIIRSARLSLQNGKRGESDDRIVYIYTFRDITDRKNVEIAQRRAVDEAEAANKAKTEFLHNMSHELRTPLNAIIGFSDIIKNELMGPVGVAQYLEYIGDINDSGQHLLGVVNDILDMSKIESGEMKTVEDELHIPHVIAATCRMVEERAQAAGLELLVEIDDDLPPIMADDRMIKQILLNLLSNAVKFTPEGGKVTIGARSNDDTGVEIYVSDTGIGIDAKDFDVILEPFGQADASLSREYEGTGLGLPLVKSMVDLHDGRLLIDSEVEVGSTFSVMFPVSRIVERVAPKKAGTQAAAVA